MNEIRSTQMSIIQQEAPKSCVKDVIQGAPGLIQRRLHDDYEFANKDCQQRPSCLIDNRASCETQVLKEPVQAINRSTLKTGGGAQTSSSKQGQINLPLRKNSSECLDSSVGSELENEEQEETPLTVSVKQWKCDEFKKQIQNQAQNAPGKHSSGSQDAVMVSPLFLEKLDDLYGRIQVRDHKISKLKSRCKALKKNVQEAEKLNQDLNEQLLEKESENQGLQILVQKF